MSFEAPRPRKPFPNSSPAEADLFRGELSTCKDAHQASAAGQVPPLRKYRAHNSFGAVVMIAKLRTRSPAGERQVSHSPASAIRPPSFSATA
jgi:hypothetical protein